VDDGIYLSTQDPLPKVRFSLSKYYFREFVVMMRFKDLSFCGVAIMYP